jgi:hypothetical protein
MPERAGAAGFYRHCLDVLAAGGIPFLVGGAYALAHQTGVRRFTKDIDIFILPADCARALAALAAAGYETEVTDPVWLAKARSGDDFVDVVFSSGNGVARVDAGWLEHGEEAEVLGAHVKLCPPEETIWSKAFIMERERYDGADVAHLLHACGRRLDWRRLLARFDRDWPVLLSHLVLFDYVYPDERAAVPRWVRRELLERLQARAADPPRPGRRRCRGPLLSKVQYAVDLECWGYRAVGAPQAEPASPERAARRSFSARRAPGGRSARRREPPTPGGPPPPGDAPSSRRTPSRRAR